MEAKKGYETAPRSTSAHSVQIPVCFLSLQICPSYRLSVRLSPSLSLSPFHYLTELIKSGFYQTTLLSGFDQRPRCSRTNMHGLDIHNMDKDEEHGKEWKGLGGYGGRGGGGGGSKIGYVSFHSAVSKLSVSSLPVFLCMFVAICVYLLIAVC